MKVGDLVEFDWHGKRYGMYGLIVSEYGKRCSNGFAYKNVYFFNTGNRHSPTGIRPIMQEHLELISESR